jgi:hypothetical protein
MGTGVPTSGVKLSIHLQLAPSLNIRAAIPLLHPYVFIRRGRRQFHPYTFQQVLVSEQQVVLHCAGCTSDASLLQTRQKIKWLLT